MAVSRLITHNVGQQSFQKTCLNPPSSFKASKIILISPSLSLTLNIRTYRCGLWKFLCAIELWFAQYKFNEQFLKVADIVLIGCCRAFREVQWPHGPPERTIISFSLWCLQKFLTSNFCPCVPFTVFYKENLWGLGTALIKDDLN